MLSPQRLREVLDYNPHTGVMEWIVCLNPRGPVGSEAGCFREGGYRVIRIDGRMYRRCRLAFLYMTGRWPEPTVDHRDTNAGNDAWDNLREATHSQNGANSRRSKLNKTGLKGVFYLPFNGKFRATIRVRLRLIQLGDYPTKEEAHRAYSLAAKRHFGQFARCE